MDLARLGVVCVSAAGWLRSFRIALTNGEFQSSLFFFKGGEKGIRVRLVGWTRGSWGRTNMGLSEPGMVCVALAGWLGLLEIAVRNEEFQNPLFSSRKRK
jgi:hypothetical protein